MDRAGKFKLLGLFLVLMMVFSMAACRTSAPDSTVDATSTQATTQAVETTAAPESVDLAWEKYESPLEVTAALRTHSAVTNLMDSWEDNVWTREYEKVFNIKVKYLWTSDYTQYTTKLNVSIASGDLPDFYSVDNSQLINVAKSNLALDATGVFEKYASPETKEVMNADVVGFDSGKVQGKLVGISTQHFGLVSLPNVVWIRDDWMKKFNLQAPRTLDDLVNICETFTTQDPDGNGKNDTYGLALCKNIYDTPTSAQGLALVDGIFNAYHAYPGIWVKDASGKIVYGSVQPEMKPGLALLQDMYKKGIISQEFGLKDATKIAEDFAAGKVGAEIGGSWNGGWPLPDTVRKYGNAAICLPYAIPSADNQPIKLGSNWPVNRYVVINKNCKNPDAVIKILNLYVKLNQTKDIEEYNKFQGEGRGWECPAFVNDPNQSTREYTQISQALETRDNSKLTGSSLGKYNSSIKWLDDKNVDVVGDYLQVGPIGAFSILQKVVDSGNYVLSEYHGVDTPTMAQKNATLEKLERETITKIILGAPLSDFDKFVTDWKALGGDAMTQEMNN